jgi:hypothetical protein
MKDLVGKRAQINYWSSVSVDNANRNIIVHDCSHNHVHTFTWDEPRRIPPRGTPVMNENDGNLAWSLGELNSSGSLRIVFYREDLFKSADSAFPNWIELQEVKP